MPPFGAYPSRRAPEKISHSRVTSSVAIFSPPCQSVKWINEKFKYFSVFKCVFIYGSPVGESWVALWGQMLGVDLASNSVTWHNNTSRHWIIMIDFYYTESQFILLNKRRVGVRVRVRLKVAKIWMKSCKEITLFIIRRVATQDDRTTHTCTHIYSRRKCRVRREGGRHWPNRFRIRSFIWATVKRTHTCTERNGGNSLI